MALDLTPGTVCVANGKMIQIDGADSLTHVRARDVATGALITVPVSRIGPIPEQTASGDANRVPEAEWKRCTALASALAGLKDQQRVPRADLLRIAKANGCSLRSVQRARTALRKNERVTALLRQSRGRRQGTNCLAPSMDSLIRHVIHKHYLRRERPSKAYVVARAQSLARRLGLAQPSKKAVLARIAQEKGWAVDTARLGRKAASQKWEPRPGQLQAIKPLELIQIDHTPADVLLLSDDRQTVIGRPWVTVAIDVATRCVAGMYITMDPPSSVSVSLCIEHMVLPKPENADNATLWPMYGKPQRILVDNGKDFRAEALKRGCEEHGIELTWRPVRTPHFGAHIERLIGTLMQICHLLPGTTFSNTRQRGDYPSEKRAILTLGEFRQWMTQKVCQHYHVRKHRALGVAPLVAWERGLINDAGQLVPPPLLSRPLDFRMSFLPFAFRKMRRTGIEFGASRYWHEELAPLLNRREEVLFHFDPRSTGQIWVRRNDGLLVEAPAIAGRAVGQPGSRLVLDVEKLAELERRIDAGFEATDQIEKAAAAEKAKAKRSGRKRATQTNAAPPAASPLAAMPAMRSATSLPAAEEWV